MNIIETYHTALLCASLVAILALLQSFLGAAIKFGPGKGTAGLPVVDRMIHSHFAWKELI